MPLPSWLRVWWGALLHPQEAGRLVAQAPDRPGLGRRLFVTIAALYALYGAIMGIFLGRAPAFYSGLKLPLLFLATQVLCFPAFYVLNCLAGPRFTVCGCVRLLLLATSANAVALASYAPISLFFSFTTARDGYLFMALMHVAVFALSGGLSVAVVPAVFRAAAAHTTGQRTSLWVIGAWMGLYGFVGTEMAWLLRPWLGWWGVEYAPFRPIQGSFVESLWFMVTRL
jgi:hypothetical protein